MIDTLTYNDGTFNTDFLINGQEALMQWYMAPADLIIKKVGFYCTQNPGNNGAEFKIVKVEWTEDSLLAILDNIGYYPALGNGCNDITAFGYDATGPWISQNGHLEPFGPDIWSDNGNPIPFTPNPNNVYQWINMSILFEPSVLAGEIFGIALKNNANCGTGPIGFLAGQVGLQSWKFYPFGRLDPGVDIGWWTRDITLDFPVVVDIVSSGMINFNYITQLNSTLSTEPREVLANIQAEGVPVNIPLISKLFYSADQGSSWNFSVMEYLGNFDYRGIIPGFPAITNVEYYLEVTDTSHGSSNTVISPTFSYTVFGTSGAKTLVVFNGYTDTTGYPQDYFFGPDIRDSLHYFPHDTWIYGPLTSELLNQYDNLIEICNGAPEDYNDSIVRPWLAATGNRNYYLEGQEWLGQRYNYADTNFVAGDFEFDVLGINHAYNDVSYNGTSGQTLPSNLIPQPGTLFGQALIDRFNTYFPLPDSIQYNPMYLGNSGDDNWIDGFTVESNVEVDVLTETRGINGVPNVQDLPCAMHRILPDGNKIFFASYWTYAVNTATNINMPTYHWLGFTNASPAYQALLWFGAVLIDNVEQNGNNIPDVFSLAQNYPNPFNPVTTIKYTIPTSPFNPSPYQGDGQRERLVTLKVYDILGSEVATLVNNEEPAGSYEVAFDASRLASGIYFYRLQVIDPESNSGRDFIDTKKMVLVK
jgi:hypothetical protein